MTFPDYRYCNLELPEIWKLAQDDPKALLDSITQSLAGRTALLNLLPLSIKELAGRTGQLLNLSLLTNDTGVSGTTLAQWVSLLEASFIIFRLKPYYENLGKRIVKSPKLYFTDPGLAAYLIGINDSAHVRRDPLVNDFYLKTHLSQAATPVSSSGIFS